MDLHGTMEIGFASLGYASIAASFQANAGNGATPNRQSKSNEKSDRVAGQSPINASGQSSSKNSQELSEEEQQQVRKLKARDKEVRAHEQAHKTVGGSLAGAITYEFTKGPDGKKYAVGGEVKIDTSPVNGDPDATIRKAELIQRAALAPAEPSPQDRKVAAEAAGMEMQARVEKREMEAEEAAEKDLSRDNNSGDSLSESTSQKLQQAFHLADTNSTGLNIAI